MNRRSFLCSVIGSLLAAPVAAEAQRAARVHRIGVLVGGLDAGPPFGHFLQGLRELGYVQGNNLLIEYRSAEGKTERLPQLAADLVRLKVDVIVAVFATPARAAHQATRSIPIVMIAVGDPVGTGLVAGLARPGGNVTGTVSYGPELVGKMIEVFKEVLPNLRRLAVLSNPSNPSHVSMLQHLEVAARPLDIELRALSVVKAEELEEAFRTAARDASGVFIPGDAMFVGHRAHIAALVLAARLPTLFFSKVHVEAGGLMSYGPSFPPVYRRAATYVDRILKGAAPADLPIEQPTEFELVINLKTAKALGLTIPPSILARADQVIE